jgi:putative two-component system response regulator
MTREKEGKEMNIHRTEEKATILVVEDDNEMYWMIKDLLEREGHSAVVAQSGEEALEMLGLGEPARPEPLVRPDLALLDVLMDGVDGHQVCQMLKGAERLGYIPVIMVTVLDSLPDKVRGLECGADDYITKPFRGEELLARIRAQLRVKRLHDKLKRAQEELRQSHVKLRRALEGTVHTLVSAIEMRDPYTGSHQRRVTQLAWAIANEMGLPEERIEGLRMAGLIHDLGKITVPAQILSKPSQLTELEYGLIKMHPQVGYDVLKEMDFPWPVAQIVLQHHERMDGSGYPQGLSGEEIILEARILGVADVIEAMASHRPYRAPRGIDKALKEISQNKGILYDPEVVDACVKLFAEKGFEFE